MGIILHLVFVYGLPILCYLLAHKMPNKKWLTIYAIFWFAVLGVGIYDLCLVSNLPDGDNDLSLGWAILIGVLFWTSIAALVGTISQAIVLYLTFTGRTVKISIVHLISFISILISPALLLILGLLLTKF